MIRLRRVEVDAYIERSRVRPGELDHLLYGPDAYIEQEEGRSGFGARRRIQGA